MQKRILVLGIVSISCLACLLAIVVLGTIGVDVTGLWPNKAIEDHNFPLKQRWVYSAEEDIQAITIGPDGQIVARTNSSIFTLTATNGELAWSVNLPKTFGGGAPIISAGIVVVSHFKGTNAYNMQTGELLWQDLENTSRGHQTFVAAANDDVAVIVGGFIAVHDLKTGELLWQIERATPGLGALAAVDEENLYVIFLNQIRCYEIASGELIWTSKTPVWSLRSGLFRDNILYLENSLQDGVGAFDVKIGEMLWQKPLHFSTHSNPITRFGDYLFVPVDDYVSIALDVQTGEVIWEGKGLPSDTYLTSLVVDDVVYQKALFERNLYALELQSGNTIGYLDLGLPEIFPSARTTSVGPLLSNSVIVFADNERVFAYGK